MKSMRRSRVGSGPLLLAVLCGTLALGCGNEDSTPSDGEDAPSDPSDGNGAKEEARLGEASQLRGRTDGTSLGDSTRDDGSPIAGAEDDSRDDSKEVTEMAEVTVGTSSIANPLTNPLDGPQAGNPDGHCAVPREAAPVDTSRPDRVVGTGTAASCTGDAFIGAVAAGGLIRFDCGADPVTITLDRPAKVRNDASDEIVIDGQGKVTLSGGGRTRILYMNTCDGAQKWTTDHCDNQDLPHLTVQNLTFSDGNSRSEPEYDGGGAIWVRGGRVKVINSRFFNNTCAEDGPDVGGAGLRVFSQYEQRPVYVVNTTFGGREGFGNRCSNGGGLSSIDVSWSIINSLFSYNEATGDGGNPAAAGTPGGGSGGAIYNDGNTINLDVCGTRIEHNDVQAFGSAIFFVSNSHTGTLRIEDSIIRGNTGGDWNVLPGISMHEDTAQFMNNSVIE
jgi:hypothetical protein